MHKKNKIKNVAKRTSAEGTSQPVTIETPMDNTAVKDLAEAINIPESPVQIPQQPIASRRSERSRTPRQLFQANLKGKVHTNSGFAFPPILAPPPLT